MSDDQQTADVHSRIDRIEVTLTHVTDAIEKMAAVVNRPQKTQWGPILTAVGLLFVAGGGYTTLVTAPMEREAHVLRQKIQNLEARELDDARSLGRIEGTLGIKVDDE